MKRFYGAELGDKRQLLMDHGDAEAARTAAVE